MHHSGMHLAAVAVSALVVQSGVVSPGDPVAIQVVGKPPAAPLRVYLADSSGIRHRLATIARGRRGITVRFPRLPVDHYRLVGGRGTLAVRAPAPPGFGPLGAADCSPPSPTDGRDIFGTSAGAQFWALPFWRADAAVGKDVKTVFKLTSHVPTVFYAVSPDGRVVQPDWFTVHGSSSWNRPGFEWGAGFTFDGPGCWRIHAGAFPAQGDLWLVVNS
jgi:hypothetical protein